MFAWPAKCFQSNLPSIPPRNCTTPNSAPICEVGARTILHEVAMDDYSYVVNDAQITYTTIGKFCSIAAMTRINPGNHPMHRASQAHFTYRASAYFPGESDDAEFFEWRRAHHVDIGHDVWIGHGAIMLPGRNIGTGAVIAAGAIVTKDVPAYTIVAGNPARPIRRRFPEEIADRLRRSPGGTGTMRRCARALPDFRKLAVEDFLAKYEAAAGSARRNSDIKVPHRDRHVDRRRPGPARPSNSRKPRCGSPAARSPPSARTTAAARSASMPATCWCCRASSTCMAMRSSGR